jgi:hypothetical protein
MACDAGSLIALASNEHKTKINLKRRKTQSRWNLELHISPCWPEDDLSQAVSDSDSSPCSVYFPKRAQEEGKGHVISGAMKM